MPATVPTTFSTNGENATPVANELEIVGTGSITTAGSGNTITISSTASPFSPNSTVQIFDDFLSNVTSGFPGYLAWNAIYSTGQLTDGTATNPGICVFPSGFAHLNGLVLGFCFSSPPKGNPILFGGGSYAVNWVFNLVGLSSVGDRYIAYVGFIDNFDNNGTIRSMVNGVYFSYSDNVNAGNWVLNCTAGGITTSVNTAIAAVTGFNNFGVFVNEAGTLATFFINGVSVGTIATHIPISAGQTCCPGIVLTNADSTTFPLWELDLFYMQYTLTTPR